METADYGVLRNWGCVLKPLDKHTILVLLLAYVS